MLLFATTICFFKALWFFKALNKVQVHNCKASQILISYVDFIPVPRPKFNSGGPKINPQHGSEQRICKEPSTKSQSIHTAQKLKFSVKDFFSKCE